MFNSGGYGPPSGPPPNQDQNRFPSPNLYGSSQQSQGYPPQNAPYQPQPPYGGSQNNFDMPGMPQPPGVYSQQPRGMGGFSSAPGGNNMMPGPGGYAPPPTREFTPPSRPPPAPLTQNPGGFAGSVGTSYPGPSRDTSSSWQPQPTSVPPPLPQQQLQQHNSWPPPPGPRPVVQGGGFLGSGPSPPQPFAPRVASNGSNGFPPSGSSGFPSSGGGGFQPNGSNGYLPNGSSGSQSWQPPAVPPPPRQNSGPYAPPAGPPHMPPQDMQFYTAPSTGQASSTSNAPPSMGFAYSQCTGKKKALCIGINYMKQGASELRGCINDANNMKEFIKTHFGYKEENIVLLTDDAREPIKQPTKANIERAMQWLVQGAQPNDSLFFHYSGHGGYTKDQDGDETDGYDEVIYPVDHKKAGHIVDDYMHDTMVKPLPAGCRLTAIFDSCHSGSALDLPFVYSTEGKVKEPNVAAESASTILGVGKSYLAKDYGGMMKGVTNLVRTAASGGGAKANEHSRKTKISPADVISWAGCKDSQTSADVMMSGQGTGAMSYAFMTAVAREPRQTYQQLLISIRRILREKYSQKPQLSSSHPMDTSVIFVA